MCRSNHAHRSLSIKPASPLICHSLSFRRHPCQGRIINRGRIRQNWLGRFFCYVKRILIGRGDWCLLCLRVFHSHFTDPIVPGSTMALICTHGLGSSFLSVSLQSSPVRSTPSPRFTSTLQQNSQGKDGRGRGQSKSAVLLILWAFLTIFFNSTIIAWTKMCLVFPHSRV